MAHPKWNILHPAGTQEIPTLLYRFMNASGFTLRITDMFHIWSSQMSREQIIEQATNSKSSIDPSEDASQYDVLLSKLGEALAGSPGTTLSLIKGQKENHGSFSARAVTSLPAPLGQLEWEFQLERLEQEAFTQEIVIPMLDHQSILARQIQSLKVIIEQKDTAIVKLLDKIEGSSIDLSVVFPGLLRGGKRGVSVEQASRAVPGLQRFREDDFSKELGLHRNIGHQVDGLVECHKVLSEGMSAFGRAARPTTNGQIPRWIENLPKEYLPAPPKSTSGPSLTQAGTVANEEDSDETATDDEDDFERQETPPKVKAKTSRPQQEPAIRSPVPASISDSSEPEEPRIRSDPFKVKKLGALGMREKPKPTSDHTSDITSPSPEELSPKGYSLKASSPASSHAADSAATATSSDDEQPRRPPKPSTPTKLLSKLGTIGGKKKGTGRNISITPERQASVGREIPEKSTPTKRKIGALGGTKSRLPERGTEVFSTQVPSKRKVDEMPAASTSGSQYEDDAGRKGQAKSGEMTKEKTIEETEEEKANRKRNELRSQLRKGPVQKKKRKF